MAGERTAINGMDSACLPNLLLVLYFLNEDVSKGKPSVWLSDIWGCGIRQELFVDNRKAPERNNDPELYMMSCKKYSCGPEALE